MIIKLKRLSKKYNKDIYGYLGFCNLTGSIKDKPALMMVEQLKRQGVKKGTYIIEGTAGNTGTGLAWYCRREGYKFIAVVPDKVSSEKIEKLKGICDRVVICPTVDKDNEEFYIKKCIDLEKELSGIYIDQFNNHSNIKAHEVYTGPEIENYFGNNKLDVIVCGVGTGGTLKGLSNYFSTGTSKPNFIIGDPEGSIYHKIINNMIPEAQYFSIEGIGSSYITPFFDKNIVNKAYSIRDDDAYLTCREFYNDEGLCCGGSSGVQLEALKKYCHENQSEGARERILVILPDHGANYIEKIYKEHECI